MPKDTFHIIFNHRVIHITVILFQYFSTKLKVSSLEKSNEDQFSEIEILREELSEISTDMKSCTEKEAKLLEFTEKLTETNVSLQVGSCYHKFFST